MRIQLNIRSFPRELWNEFLGEGKKSGKTAAKILKEAIILWLAKHKKN
jgi:hypothetical protein